MNIYFFLIYLIFINLFFKNFKNKKIEAMVIVVPMFISLATQVDIGRDYYSYIKIFLDPIHNKKVEIGYYLFTNILKYITSNYRVLFVGISALQMSLFYIILLKLYKKKIIDNFYLFTLSFVIFTPEYRLMFNGLRSSVATLFFTLFILDFEKRKIRSTLFAILALSFHKSSIIGIIIVVCFNKLLKKDYSKKKIFLLLLFSFLVNRIDIIHKVAFYIYHLNLEIPYKKYLVSHYMFPYYKNFATIFLIYLYLLLYSISIFFQNKNDHSNKFFYNISILYISFFLLFYEIPILQRITEYGNIFVSVFLYKFLKKIKNKNKMLVIISIIALFVIKFLIAVHNNLETNKTSHVGEAIKIEKLVYKKNINNQKTIKIYKVMRSQIFQS